MFSDKQNLESMFPGDLAFKKCKKFFRVSENYIDQKLRSIHTQQMFQRRINVGK